MDVCTCAHPVSEDVGCKHHPDSPFFDSKSLFCFESGTCSKSNLLIIPPVGTSSQEEFGTGAEDNSKVEELGIAFERILQVRDIDDQLSDCTANLDGKGKKDAANGEKICEELKHLKLDPSNVITKKELKKCATFPCSNVVMSSACIDGREAASATMLQSNEYVKNESFGIQPMKSTYARSVSLISNAKLVSAMKGGREHRGKPLNVKLSVKWAPDVYDPPSTSMSHTVKNYQQYSRSKKKDHKHKHKHKGKSYRGSGGDKKHTSQRSMQAPLDKLHSDGFGHSATVYEITGNDSKCGSGCLFESITKVQTSVAEAS